MVDKDFTGRSQSVPQGNVVPSLTTRVIQPVKFIDGKPDYPTTKEIQYNENGQPISPRYDDFEAEAPKDSSVQVPAVSLNSVTEPSAETVPVEKDSGQPKEQSDGTQPGSPTTPTLPGKPEPPATPKTAPKK